MKKKRNVCFAKYCFQLYCFRCWFPLKKRWISSTRENHRQDRNHRRGRRRSRTLRTRSKTSMAPLSGLLNSELLILMPGRPEVLSTVFNSNYNGAKLCCWTVKNDMLSICFSFMFVKREIVGIIWWYKYVCCLKCPKRKKLCIQKESPLSRRYF